MSDRKKHKHKRSKEFSTQFDEQVSSHKRRNLIPETGFLGSEVPKSNVVQEPPPEDFELFSPLKRPNQFTEQIHHETAVPISSLSDSSSIHYKIEPSSTLFIRPASFYFEAQLQIQKSDGSKLFSMSEPTEDRIVKLMTYRNDKKKYDIDLKKYEANPSLEKPTVPPLPDGITESDVSSDTGTIRFKNGLADNLFKNMTITSNDSPLETDGSLHNLKSFIRNFLNETSSKEIQQVERLYYDEVSFMAPIFSTL